MEETKQADRPRVRYEIPPWVDKTKVPAIFPAMVQINREIEAVAKERRNQQQGYNFRGIDQVYDMIHSVIAAAGVFTVPVVLQRHTSEKTAKSGGGMVLVEMEIEYWCYAEDGSAVVLGPIWSEGLDNSDKASNKALSFAQKYALIQTFTIPTSDVAEGDKTTHERGAPATEQQEQAPAPERSISADLADKIYAAFADFGVTRAQLDQKIGKPVVGLAISWRDTLHGWKEECSRDKRRIGVMFGGNGSKSRADELNAKASAP